MQGTEFFKALFAGATGAHGLWHPKKGPSTRRLPATEQDWLNHLTGICGIGMIPVRVGATCVFAAIDIDVDTIDHAELAQKVKALGLPLTICRSKSGGAHAYIFFEEPGKMVAPVRKRMAMYAASLGYPKAEIFPKQDALLEGDVGNWINLPYYDIENTNRYAVTDTGSKLSFEEFLATVIRIPSGQDLPLPVVNNETSWDGAPPCLEALMKTGIAPGSRNNGLFDFGVFFRKSMEEGWDERLMETNYKVLDPPLKADEVKVLIKSLKRKNYEYLCEQEPIHSVCDRPTCLSRKFGVGKNKDSQYDELILGNVKKLLTDPPRYYVEVYGIELDFDAETFCEYRIFRRQVFQFTNNMPPKMSQDDWEMLIKSKMKDREDLEAPEDASARGQIKFYLNSFLKRREKSEKREDVLKGKPYTEPKVGIIFRGTDFVEYLRQQKIDSVKGPKLWSYLRNFGCSHYVSTINGKSTNLWTIPVENIDEQTEPFETPPAPQEEF